MDVRLRAACQLFMPSVREEGGRHEYDGQLYDLSPDGVQRALAALGGDAYDDPHDDRHVSSFEALAQTWFGTLEVHRWNPDLHMRNLNLVHYEREYAPAAERAAARREHLARWPEAVDMALASLDRVTAPMATALLSSAVGLHAQIPRTAADDDAAVAAGAAVDRLVAHLGRAARDGDPDASIGADNLARLMTASESSPFDLGRMSEIVERETERLGALLAQACERLRPGLPVRAVVAELLGECPRTEDDILDAARAVTQDLLAFTAERGLVPHLDGSIEYGLDHQAQDLFFANMRFCAPEEPDSPSTYHLTPPDWSWPPERVDGWLQTFSPTLLGSMSAHEAAPGHFAHARSLRRVQSLPRRVLLSYTFAEGWAHYAEELCVEEGFRSDDPRFVIGVCIWSLVRVTRLACAIGLHSGAMTVRESAHRFERDAFFPGPAARQEANRGLFDPMYARFTWGKLAILDAREQARRAWGTDFSLGRFHAALFSLGSPPIGLLGAAVAAG